MEAISKRSTKRSVPGDYFADKMNGTVVFMTRPSETKKEGCIKVVMGPNG